MTDHKFTVETPERVICFSLTSEEAKAAYEWMTSAQKLLRNVHASNENPPAIIRELFGGFSAIAENRPYGGH